MRSTKYRLADAELSGIASPQRVSPHRRCKTASFHQFVHDVANRAAALSTVTVVLL
ncbi:hypothetical protein [Rhizobium freirei]|uniref:hypothetical protein n=1 Tax=Rhizobium freirei TaxID=1353277 RepID=UPI0003A7EFF9|nr:hypothetical protein [Rhizobium freirei]